MNEKPDIFVFFANARESRILSPRKQGSQVINNDKLMVVHVNLPQGKKIAPHDHQGQDIYFSVVKGQVKATLNNSEEHTLSPGTLLHFGGEAFIGIEALVDSEFFVYLINL